ncbi:glycerol-3-phosphate acyltransferase 4 isoform X2 [Dermacentor silvarum]|nr:glycerol-3-phosphate acyltransferase 4 isoform X2 [Dermacentor silvarum]
MAMILMSRAISTILWHLSHPCQLFVTCASSVLLLLFFLSVTNTSLGIRKQYIRCLLKLFEYGRIKIERANRQRLKREESAEDLTDLDSEPINTTTSVITRDDVIVGAEQPIINIPLKEYHLGDITYFIKKGVEAIIDDVVTKRFATEELPSWNLLTRTNKNYTFVSFRLTIIWCIGCLLRYVILFPMRVALTCIGMIWLICCTAILGYFPEGRLKRFLYWHISLITFRILSRAVSAIVTYHNRENRAKPGGICVANHTSPIDVAMLASDNCYALVGQTQGGFIGVIQTALNKATSHIWFERAEIKDRQAVAKRLREHVEDPMKLPILIFPEGTCINNTSVMQFKKGSFEVGGTIYPAAIKYDARFGDAFWNSSKQNYIHYLAMMMSSWAIVCDVWYLPPMKKRDDESSVEFANRVKSKIAEQGGLLDLNWDGLLKRTYVKREWKEQQQKDFSQRLKLT